ncbi:uncharacterized protein TNCV_3571721 [Trichonephila clavipes]|nr:uncharacterized protein TNCV_3571721 [Trichonephila clavipes]
MGSFYARWCSSVHCKSIEETAEGHFGNARVISHHFPIALWPQSPDPNACDFCHWDYLTDVVSAPIARLAELKSRIAQHILNVTPETLRSVSEHAVSRFKLNTDNRGQNIEHVLHLSLEI